MGKGIAVAGNMIVDVIKLIDRFPERNGLIHIVDKSYSLGGAVNNTGRDLAALDPGMPVRAVGLIGEDEEGDQILKGLAAYPNIDTGRVLRKGLTSFTDVLTDSETRERSFMFFGGASDLFDCRHVDADNLNCDIFHIGYILLLKALDEPDETYGTRMARLLHDVQARGIKTSVDLVSEVGDRYSRIVPPALRYTDYLIVNELEAGMTTGISLRDGDGALLPERIPDVLTKLFGMGVKEWAVIHAPEGGFGMDRAGHFIREGSLMLPEGYIAGTVGAGDAFCAGVLYGAYKGESLRQSICDGIGAAAMSLAAPGASEAMRSIGEVRTLYESMPKRAI